MLMILDGWGIAENEQVSAIHKANTPFVDSLYSSCPNTALEASGRFVGLPEGQMGNSEVGHMNLGAGRIVYQELERINQSIASKEFFERPALRAFMQQVKKSDRPLHLMGLVSDGGVHSHLEHLKALCTMAHSFDLKEVYIHAFTDGRDCDPKSGSGHLQDLEQHLASTTGTISSVIGRYYAMDRDRRWERTQKAYDLMVHRKGRPFESVQQLMNSSYEAGITDEFVEAAQRSIKGVSLPGIKDGDSVICFNFRTDRGRQISEVLTQTDQAEYGMKALDLNYLTMTRYDESFDGIEIAFEKEDLLETIGEVISKAGRTQVRIAETEKYPHVTFFFSGGREAPFPGERRLLCPSPKVATYDLQPEMSAEDIKDRIIQDISENQPDFICLNFANPDMVGHTGVMEAAVKACETVDRCAEQVAKKAIDAGYSIIILADHGNADRMENPDGSPHTAHTTRPVPCFLLGGGTETRTLRNGVLGDVAPTLLELMEIDAPDAMTGKSLLI
jgi:2,3-bisphosphoglycerate-independent phosphoglycerate mutase